jgi:hypothetical protein
VGNKMQAPQHWNVVAEAQTPIDMLHAQRSVQQLMGASLQLLVHVLRAIAGQCSLDLRQS